MRQKTGFPRPYLVTSAPEHGETARRDAIARNAIRNIEACRAELIDGGHLAAAKVLDIALLELSMSINGVSYDELKFITEELHADIARSSAEREDRA